MRRQLTESLHILLEAFHPLHFIASMGVGITSGIMYNFPIESVRHGMKYIGIIYFFINLFILVVNHTLFALKYLILPYYYDNHLESKYSVLYRVKIMEILHKPELTIFMGASSMSFTTMVNMLFFLKPHWKRAIFVFWWINFFQALCCIFIITFFLLSYPTNVYKYDKESEVAANSHLMLKEKNEFLSKVTPAYLLPLVTTTVTSASGALITSIVSDENTGYLLSMIIVTFMLFSIAITSSMVFIPIIFTRIMTFGLPKFHNSFTMFVPIGIMGQGGFSMVLNTVNLTRFIKLKYFKHYTDEEFEIIDKLITLQGVSIAVLFLSFGILLTIWGSMTIMYWYIGWPNSLHNVGIRGKETRINGFPVWTPKMWAATFPFGTIALSGLEIYKVSHIIGFKILSAIYAFAVIIITTWCMVGTLVYVVPWERLVSVWRSPRREIV